YRRHKRSSAPTHRDGEARRVPWIPRQQVSTEPPVNRSSWAPRNREKDHQNPGRERTMTTPEQQLNLMRTQLEDWRDHLDHRRQLGHSLRHGTARDITTRNRIEAILNGVKQ